MKIRREARYAQDHKYRDKTYIVHYCETIHTSSVRRIPSVDTVKGFHKFYRIVNQDYVHSNDNHCFEVALTGFLVVFSKQVMEEE